MAALKKVVYLHLTTSLRYVDLVPLVGDHQLANVKKGKASLASACKTLAKRPAAAHAQLLKLEPIAQRRGGLKKSSKRRQRTNFCLFFGALACTETKRPGTRAVISRRARQET